MAQVEAVAGGHVGVGVDTAAGAQAVARADGDVWIDNAKIVAIMAVVLLHVAAAVMSAQVSGSAGWHVATWFNSLGRWGVPVFVIVSGATLLGLARQEAPADFYRRRAGRILVPLLFWSAFYVGWTGFKRLAKAGDPEWADLLWRWAQGKPSPHLWFLYMIVGLYLVTPWLRRALDGMPAPQLRAAAALLFVLMMADVAARHLGLSGGQPHILLWFVEYLPYFLLGAYAMRHMGDPPSPSGLRRAVLATAVALALLMLGFAPLHLGLGGTWSDWWHENLGPAVIVATLAMLPLLRHWRTPLFGRFNRRLADWSFGIYLVHGVVLGLLLHTKAHLAPLSGPGSAALILAGLALTLTASLAVVSAMRGVPGLRRLV